VGDLAGTGVWNLGVYGFHAVCKRNGAKTKKGGKEKEMDTQPVKDIFKRDDGGPVEPPDNMKALFDEITLAVDRYIKAGSDCIGTCITESEKSTNDDDVARWGGCPECHENHGYRFYGRDIYFVCLTHWVTWYVGSNLFSGYQHMTPDALLAQKLELQFGYRIVEAWYPPREEPANSRAVKTSDGSLF
jgi:hypothetical protein